MKNSCVQKRTKTRPNQQSKKTQNSYVIYAIGCKSAARHECFFYIHKQNVNMSRFKVHHMWTIVAIKIFNTVKFINTTLKKII